MKTVITKAATTTMTGNQLINTYYDVIFNDVPIIINSYLQEKKIYWMDSYHKDAVRSDVFVKILRKGSMFNPAKASFKTWLRTLTVNALIDYIKVYKVGESIFFTDEEGHEVERPDLNCDVEFTAEEEYVAAELFENLERFLEGRADEDKVIMTRIISGYKPAEIAEDLGMTPNAVSGRLFKMRQAFAEFQKEAA